MEKTQETKADVKNGVKRFVFACLSILLEVLVIFAILLFAGSKASWVYTFLRVLALALVLSIFGSSKTSSIRMTWMFVILLLPICGTTLYFLIGLNGHSLKMRKRYSDIDKILFPMLPDDTEAFENAKAKNGHLGGLMNYIRRNAGYPVYQNTEVQYFDDGAKGIEAQKKDMAKAEKFIFMEYHAIEDKESWHAIRDVLVERVKAGVEVRVFYDDMGSIGFINTDFVKRTQELGIQCRVFNPFAPGLNVFLNNRDHRKITVIDGKVGYTGGYNLANEYFHLTEPYGFWKDSGIRLEGDAVQSLTVTFLEMWNAANPDDKDDKDYRKYLFASGANYVLKEQGHVIKDDNMTTNAAEKLEKTVVKEEQKIEKDLSKNGAFRALENQNKKIVEGSAERLEKDRERLKKNQEEYFDKMKEEMSQDNERYLADTEVFVGKHLGFVQPYADSPMDDVHVGEDVYISMAESAENYAWFITPYLIITDEMCHAFALAARRGVDVRVITPGIPDKKLIYNVTRSYYNGLAKHGVKIYEYTPGFCHAKMSIADDLVATCGTINLDYRSLYHHFENGCLFADCPAVMDVKRDFEETMAQSREVTDFYVNGRGAFMRLEQLLLRLAAPLM